ncbi:MAG: 50S ribosomal protein L15 [Candidatus Tectomicrobia bacterium]|uniref:Large ribosomal subunit protein uL15 n=1 Tax=Tectimicrobiota bacterium TaxID=2528274 RepID=A0A933LQ83_UNCTE|nr:50S ribosomal protein L15 [Candidatus Tectomicrobia bacterium]
MRQDQLKPAPGSHRNRKRVGRGLGSGHGVYSGRGAKGQLSRSGTKFGPQFEGGQLPMVKRLPYKRGFTNIFKKIYYIVNIEELNVLSQEQEVTPETLLKADLIPDLNKPVKVLGNGKLEKPLIVKVNSFSRTAADKIVAAGGKAEII